MQKLKAFGLLLAILLALIPVYAAHRWLQQRLRPRVSAGRLLLYMLSVLLLVFLLSFLVVWMLQWLLAPASG